MPQLKLRTIGVRDYAVLEGEQRICRIRLASERIEQSLPAFFNLFSCLQKKMSRTARR